MKKIFILEDDKDLIEVMRATLEADGFQVNSDSDGVTGLGQVQKSPPDLLLLDLTFPQQSGLEICKEIRRDLNLNRLPIIMVTGRADVSDRILGLEVGADDYITKPFEPKELLARIRALLRRVEPPEDGETVLQAGPLTIDPASYRVTRENNPVTMSTLEFRLLYYLASHPGKVHSRDHLLDAVWGAEHFVTPRIVDVYIRSLREKLEENASRPIFIKTQRGAGYMFEAGTP